jgi:hypothetical protein
MEDVDVHDPKYNLIYNKTVDIESQPNTPAGGRLPVGTLDDDRESTPADPKPKVNDIFTLGDNLGS